MEKVLIYHVFLGFFHTQKQDVDNYKGGISVDDLISYCNFGSIMDEIGVSLNVLTLCCDLTILWAIH